MTYLRLVVLYRVYGLLPRVVADVRMGRWLHVGVRVLKYGSLLLLRHEVIHGLGGYRHCEDLVYGVWGLSIPSLEDVA